MDLYSDEYFMREALKEARKAFEKDEVPIGAVIVCKKKIVGRGHNLTESLNDVTAHAEMQAFTAAANTLGSKYLSECTLYITLEPCTMCAGAAYWTQIQKIIFGARDEKRGYLSISQSLLHPKTETVQGVLANECAAIIQQFFMLKRKNDN